MVDKHTKYPKDTYVERSKPGEDCSQALHSSQNIVRRRTYAVASSFQHSRRPSLESSLVCPSSLSGGDCNLGRQQPEIARPDGRNITHAQIDSTINRLIQAAHVTGAGVALFHDGKVVYLKTYGLRDSEKDLPLTPDSVMTAASLTKAAFATVVMRLFQHGVLSLDKPIEQYVGKPLGDFAPYADLKGDPRTAKLTLRILLDHTAGFANFRGLEDDHKLHIHYDPGTHYSGEGINLAQFVVEKVTGKSATQLMQEELYGPLKMSRTSMIWLPRFESDFANGYDEYGRSLGAERRSSPTLPVPCRPRCATTRHS